MTRLKYFFCLLVIMLSCKADDVDSVLSKGLVKRDVEPSATDPGIDSFNNAHLAYFNDNVLSGNKLLVFLGGSFSKPTDYQVFSEFAANQGYHVINLSYPNNPSIQVCAVDNDITCFDKLRHEVVYGEDVSDKISVSQSNSIHNRILKCLQYIAALDPGNNWNQYVASDELIYADIIFAGHSQGGGHAAYIAQGNSVERMLMFSSPNDFFTSMNQPANWTGLSFQTSISKFYGFSNLRDDIIPFSRQYKIWNNMGMVALSDSLSIDGKFLCNPLAHCLYTKVDPPAPFGLGFQRFHGSTAVDVFLPLADGKVLFEPIWNCLLE